MFGKNKIEINAVQDSDLAEALKQTSQFNNLIEGKIKCTSCDTVITENNIGVIQPKNKEGKMELTFYCEKIDCVDEFKRDVNE
ncbi:MAG: hypothetical protein CMC14_00715 [Flavobacteriaceae bacterium]|nr:hypothetical protein [Flavobacteriaceae bacterium]|tara:strand:- start:13382 stop:13630 length:249 start_codon:yes stop_codon:yes gene_type:complete